MPVAWSSGPKARASKPAGCACVAARNFSRTVPPATSAAETCGQPRLMTTIEQGRPAPHTPIHVGDMDAVMWGIEDDPVLRQTMTAVLVLDQAPDRRVLWERMEHATRSLPPFRHKLVTTPLRLSTPRWLVDRNFDLS